MSTDYKTLVNTLVVDGEYGGYVRKRDVRIKVVDVYVARSNAKNLEALLIETRPEFLPPIDDWPSIEGLSHSYHNDPKNPREKIMVSLDLAIKDLQDIFFALAEDLCLVFIEADNAKNGIQKFVERLYKWQEFLKAHGREGLSDTNQAGLYGELLILDEIFLKTIDSYKAIEGWRGCKKAHQDFQLLNLALEVKATRSVDPVSIHISNVQQLDDIEIDNFFIALVCLHQNEANGQRLPDIIAQIRKKLRPPELRLFNEGLVKVGYLDTHEDLYSKVFYQVMNVRYFEVGKDFPKLTRDQIPFGVRNVKYKISIDACEPFLVDQSIVENEIKIIQK